ncbi:MAG TPA: hypothetical protein VJR89_34155, partial [Polyangiales bacterium]|nr:hypothetical protein [Polyangiales bacterium]
PAAPLPAAGAVVPAAGEPALPDVPDVAPVPALGPGVAGLPAEATLPAPPIPAATLSPLVAASDVQPTPMVKTSSAVNEQ